MLSLAHRLGITTRRAFWLATTSALLATHAINANAIPTQIPGDLDLSFAGGTGVIASLAVGGGSVDHLTSMALQPDGKLVLAGYCNGPANLDFCAARLMPDGSLDPTFIGPNGNGSGKVIFDVGNASDFVSAVAVQPDGKIVMAGSCSNGSNSDFCLARLNIDGSFDTSFNGPGGAGSGKFLVPIGASDDYITAMVLQPDGKIVVVGYCFVGGINNFCTARLTVNGSLDASFAGPGGNGGGKFIFAVGSSNDYALAVARHSSGEIVIAGGCVSAMSDVDFCVARLTASGAFDTRFDGPSAASNGKFLLPVGTLDDQVGVVIVQPDDKIVLVGRCQQSLSNTDFCAVRLNFFGSLDTTFVGPSGVGGGKFLLPITASKSDAATALAIQPDGKLLISGFCDNGSNKDFCVARLHMDGSLDASFDGPGGVSNGKFLLPIGSGNDVVNAMLLQPDGKIVLGGECSGVGGTHFCVARLYGGPFGYKNCTMDIDGDGKVLPTTDGLLFTRIALGITGSAALAGAIAPTATRNTWVKVRDYLVNQCGMAVAP